MDCDDRDSSNKDDNNDTWEWQGEEYSLQLTFHREDYPQCLWENVNTNEGDLIHMLDEQTPVKDCADLGYESCSFVDNAGKEMTEEAAESSQMKRRRMLHFSLDNHEMGTAEDQLASACVKSKVGEDSLMDNGFSENSEWNSQWNIGFEDDSCAFNCEELNEGSEGWLVDCLNDDEMYCTLNQMDDSMPNNDQVVLPDSDNISRGTETSSPLQKPGPSGPSPIKIIKGVKSFLKTPKRLVTPVVYPFALIKPCGVQGDVTLTDINQRIHAPPLSRPKLKMTEDPSVPYPTSAFSGKPVVLKTKICTEGGKGSITIMRTKG